MIVTNQLNWSRVESYYDDTAELIEHSAKAMGWSSEFNQTLRFDVFNFHVPLDNLSILDVGCGDGSFYHYLQSQSIQCDYTGIDLSSKMVQRAQDRFPGINVRKKDFFEERRFFDVVICSGALSMLPEIDGMVFLKCALDHLFSLTNGHLLFNLLTTHSDSKSHLFHRFNPSEVLDLCFRMTPYVSLNHSYLPNDFTIHMTKS